MPPHRKVKRGGVWVKERPVVISPEKQSLIQENREWLDKFDSRLNGTDYTPPVSLPKETVLERMARFRKKVLTFEGVNGKHEEQ